MFIMHACMFIMHACLSPGTHNNLILSECLQAICSFCYYLTVLVVAVEPEVSAVVAAVQYLTGMADQRQQSYASHLHPDQEIDHWHHD